MKAVGVIGSLVLGLFLALLALFLYTALVMLPVAAITEAECLQKGYPESKVTVGLSRYCVNMDGTVTIKVEKLQ